MLKSIKNTVSSVVYGSYKTYSISDSITLNKLIKSLKRDRVWFAILKTNNAISGLKCRI